MVVARGWGGGEMESCLAGEEDFPGSPVIKPPGFHGGGHRFDPWSGN